MKLWKHKQILRDSTTMEKKTEFNEPILQRSIYANSRPRALNSHGLLLFETTRDEGNPPTLYRTMYKCILSRFLDKL